MYKCDKYFNTKINENEFPTLIMMIGLPGSGKSIYAKRLLDKYKYKMPIAYLSSDVIRHKLGLGYTKNDNIKVFKVMRDKTFEFLKTGTSVIYDATNLTMRFRKNLLNDLYTKMFFNSIAIVMATPFEQCILNDSGRPEEQQVRFNKINRMLENFSVPFFNEGFSDIWIVKETKFIKNSDECVSPKRQAKRFMNFDQKTPYHRLTLGEHLIKTEKLLPRFMKNYGLMHDIGKVETQRIYRDTKNDVRAAYYNHPNVSSYKALLLKHLSCKELVDMSFVILKHMERYGNYNFLEKNKNMLPPDILYKINLLNKADAAAH